MVTLSSADNALKSVYLGVVANQLNVNANPLLAKIKHTTQDVWGKEIIKLAPFGINGGIGAGGETDALPTAASNNYVQFKTTLKNLYGKLEISDKAIRASQNNAGAFVNLLNDEMEGLIKASSFNFGRMLYGDGTGKLCTVESVNNSSHAIKVESVRNLIEGMVVDFYNADNAITGATGLRISYVDRTAKEFFVNFPAGFDTTTIVAGAGVYVQGSKDHEITGLGSIFTTTGNLYGLSKQTYKWLKPFISDTETEISDSLIQGAIDYVEQASGSQINYISCSSEVRRAYQEYLGAYRRNIDVMELAGGYKAITYNGIPVVADRFAPEGSMYLLNTNDFTMHQLCDWKWLEGEDGKVIKQNANYPTYSATLVKYADLICDRPCGQAMIKNISSTVTNPFVPNVTNA